MRKILKLGCLTAVTLAILILGGIYGFTDTLVALFNSEGSAELAAYAHTGLRLYFIGFIFAGFNIVGTGFLSATQQAKEAFVTSILRGFAGILACSVVMAVLFGINGVWLAFPVSEFLTSVLMSLILFRRKRVQ